MKASVIIPTYNRSSLLQLTLQSLVHQTIETSEYEIIIVDDGSSDDTPKISASFQNRLSVTYIFQEDKGFRAALARNKGIKAAKNELLIFIDTGVVVHSTFIEAHIHSHINEQHPCAVIGYVFGYDFEEDKYKKKKNIDFNHPDAMIGLFKEKNQYPDIRDVVYKPINDNIMKLPAPWCMFWTVNVSVKKSIMENVKCFDAELFTQWGVEDLECGYRLYNNNVTLKISRTAICIHYPHHREQSDELATNDMNKILFYEKHKKIDTELFLAVDSVLVFNTYYQAYLSAREKCAGSHIFSLDIPSTGITKLKDFFKHQHIILFGSQDGYLLTIGEIIISCDSNIENILKVKEKQPGLDSKQGLGLHVPVSDNTGDISLIAGSGLFLPEIFFKALIKEAARVSKTVFWLKAKDDYITKSPDAALKKIMDIPGGYELYQV